MSRPVWILPRARQDVILLADYLSRNSADAADRFCDQVERLTNELARTPEMGEKFDSLNPRLDGLRASRVPGFLKYLVFHRTAHGELQIVRVLHGARDLDSALSDQ